MDHNLKEIYEGMDKNSYKRKQNLRDIYSSQILKEDVMVAGVSDNPSAPDDVLGVVDDKGYSGIRNTIKELINIEFSEKTEAYLKQKGVTERNILKVTINELKGYQEIVNNILNNKEKLPDLDFFIDNFKTTGNLTDKITKYYLDKDIIKSENKSNFEDFFNNLYIGIQGFEGGKGIGKGEIALCTSTLGNKSKVGDIMFNMGELEIKHQGGRLSDTGRTLKILGSFNIQLPELQTQNLTYTDKINQILNIIKDNKEAKEQFVDNIFIPSMDDQIDINKIKNLLSNKEITLYDVKIAIFYLDFKIYMKKNAEYMLISNNRANNIYCLVIDPSDDNLLNIIQKYVSIGLPSAGRVNAGCSMILKATEESKSAVRLISKEKKKAIVK